MKTRLTIAASKEKQDGVYLVDKVGFFTEVLSENELNDFTDDGLVGYAVGDPAGKATTTWALLKMKK